MLTNEEFELLHRYYSSDKFYIDLATNILKGEAGDKASAQKADELYGLLTEKEIIVYRAYLIKLNNRDTLKLTMKNNKS